MLKFDLSLAPFFAIAVANFLLGWAWYSPLLFMRPWVRALGKDPDKLTMSEEEKKRMPLLFGGALVSSFALSYVLQVFVHSVGAADFGQGACLGGVAWLGFVIPVLLGTLWEGRSGKVIVINLGNYLVACVVFGGIIAAWH